MKRAVISIDYERCPDHKNFSGLNQLKELLRKEKNFTIFKTQDAPVIEELKNHEIGLHLHPNKSDYKNDFLEDYKNKEELIKEAEKNFKKKPKVFRAGNWSYSEDLPAVLEKLGYTHDSSRPGDSKSSIITREENIIEIRPTVWNNRIINFLTGLFFKKEAVLCEGMLKKPLGIIFFKRALRELKKEELIHFTFHSYNLENKKLNSKILKAVELIKEDREILPLTKIKL